MGNVEVGVRVVGARVEGILIWLVSTAATPTRRILIIQKVRPSVVGIKADASAQTLLSLDLESVVIGNAVVRVAAKPLELRIGTTCGTVCWREQILWNLVDIDRKRKILAMAANIGYLQHSTEAEFTLNA